MGCGSSKSTIIDKPGLTQNVESQGLDEVGNESGGKSRSLSAVKQSAETPVTTVILPALPPQESYLQDNSNQLESPIAKSQGSIKPRDSNRENQATFKNEREPSSAVPVSNEIKKQSPCKVEQGSTISENLRKLQSNRVSKPHNSSDAKIFTESIIDSTNFQESHDAVITSDVLHLFQQSSCVERNQDQSSGLNDEKTAFMDSNTRPANLQDSSETNVVHLTNSDGSPEDIQLQNGASSRVVVPSPSAQNGSNALSALKDFDKYLRKACKERNNKKLLELATAIDTLKLDRSFYSFTKSDLLFRVVYAMKNLTILNLRGGQIGPIAFRFIANSLKGDKFIKELDLSDNLANPECSEALGNMISANSALKVLNVSGNQLGKDALSRYMGVGLHTNQNLKSLNISNCGATDLHCLLKSILESCSPLTTLTVSHNSMTHGHQFASDISLVIETAQCKLEKLDISNTSINCSGMNVIINALSKNTSLKVLNVGENYVEDLNDIGKLILNACTHPSMTVFKCNKTNVEKANSSEFNESQCAQSRELLTISKLTDLEIAGCCLTDCMLKHLTAQMNNKLANLHLLDISNNNNLSVEGLSALNTLCGNSLLKLKISLFNQPGELLSVILSGFPKLILADFTKTRLLPDDIKSILSSTSQNIHSLLLNGIKLSGGDAFSGLPNSHLSTSLTVLHLSGCQLNDDDLHPVSEALGNTPPTFVLKNMDVSVNRLTSRFFSGLVDSLVQHANHCLQVINASDNVLDGTCIEYLEKLFSTSSHVSGVKSINFSRNNITASYVCQFFSTFEHRKFPLEYFDLSNQENGFGENDMEDLLKIMKTIFFLDGSMSSDCNFVINLSGLGGADIPDMCSIDSAAMKTDFVTQRKPSLALRDIVEVIKGIAYRGKQHTVNTSAADDAISTEAWEKALNKDGPAWAVVESDLKKAAFITHMPGTVTINRLQGMLETEADCDVKDVFLVKDPIMLKPTGAAWVLFEDSQSLASAIDWFYSGNAQMYGNPFIISEIPISISDESLDAIVAAESDIAARDLEAKKQQERDKKILEESIQLAAERAEYREAHPAYQGGRIS